MGGEALMGRLEFPRSPIERALIAAATRTDCCARAKASRLRCSSTTLRLMNTVR
jgi:hypothetical protein